MSAVSPVTAAPSAPPRTIPTLPPLPRYQSLLGPAGRAQGSVSLGTPIRGQLARGVALPRRGAHHIVLARTQRRRTYFGTVELVRLIRYAAQEVARRHPGSLLSVGNLSRRTGGWLRVSRSHQSGRDADLAFYSRYRGRPVTVRRFNRFAANLRCPTRRNLSFDAPRTWTLVQALLSHPTIRVQWLIIAAHLRRALLRHARNKKVPAWLLDRARRTLFHPPGVRIHDDHIHLRIYCARDDLLVGCRDLPPFWPHALRYRKDWDRRVRALLRGLRDSTLGVRQRILKYLVRLRAVDHLGSIARVGLSDRNRTFRRSVLALLNRWRRWSGDVVKEVGRFLWRAGTGVRCRAGAPAKGCPSAASKGVGGDGLRTGRQIRMAYRALRRARAPGVAALLRQGLTSTRRIIGGGAPGYRLPEPLLAASAPSTSRTSGSSLP